LSLQRDGLVSDQEVLVARHRHLLRHFFDNRDQIIVSEGKGQSKLRHAFQWFNRFYILINCIRRGLQSVSS